MIAVAIGEPIALPAREESDAEEAKHLLRALDGYQATIWDASLGVRYDATFRRSHDHVAAMLYNDGTIELLPAQRDRGGYRASPDAAVVTNLSAGLPEITSAINAAFQRTSGLA